MTRKMIINAIDAEEVRIAILADRQLQDFDIETRGVEKNKGNIYKGVVMAVEPALNAAFVNYGADKQGFLTANDVHPKYAKQGQDHDRHAKITDLLRPKQTVSDHRRCYQQHHDLHRRPQPTPAQYGSDDRPS